MPFRYEPSREAWEDFLDTQARLVGATRDEFAAELEAIHPALDRIFRRIRNKYYREEGEPVLRLAHNAQFTIVLYLLSRAVFENGKWTLADRLYALLRMVSSADLFYEVRLPDVWGCDHPLGSVIGRGEFARDATLYFSQNCNIGNNRRVFPRITGNLHMLPNSSLLGGTQVSGNVVLANGACVIDAGELSNCMVFGRSPDLMIKPLSAERFSEIWRFEPED